MPGWVMLVATDLALWTIGVTAEDSEKKIELKLFFSYESAKFYWKPWKNRLEHLNLQFILSVEKYTNKKV